MLNPQIAPVAPSTRPIAVGWNTPDYRSWRFKLVKNLEAHSIAHDFVEVEKPVGGWERTTMLKADQVLAAMDRHPGKTLVLLDVDCQVIDKAMFDKLADVPGDVSFYLRTRFKRGGGVGFTTRSGTMVFKPTPAARKFVEAWKRLSEIAPEYAVDQDSLAVAMGKVPECVISFLDIRYCAVKGDKLADPWILHDSASNEHGNKASNTLRRVMRLFSKRIDENETRRVACG